MHFTPITLPCPLCGHVCNSLAELQEHPCAPKEGK
jgi:hypothetical protein